ncbi:MAG: hypothetical protein NVS2B3_18460 [Vulcanimicrobiaceae bacterium]
MRERAARAVRACCAIAALACAAPESASGARRVASASASPVVRGCANARLPREILDGAVAAPQRPLRTIDVEAPAARLRLAVADDERTREYGLMCVTRLRARAGMIFAFASESEWEFWMKNTLVPLDMVWVTAAGDVTGVEADVPAATRATPDTALPRRRGRGTYVIELPAREAAADGIVTGTHLSLPTLEGTR